MRFFLIDRVTELVAGERARGIKTVSLSDEVLHDHFPDYPVLPGALVLESAAQLGGFLVEMSVNKPGAPLLRAVLVQVDQARFHEPAGPGDTLEVTVTLDSTLAGAAQVAAEVRAGQRRIARATLTFVLRSIDSERVHEQRRALYRVWTRTLEPPITIP
jgi:3-hydroxymyristoyl/3-hydroxydecanoyl-(acyl carrier protein) dehydratase